MARRALVCECVIVCVVCACMSVCRGKYKSVWV